jgi:hypothetical protein
MKKIAALWFMALTLILAGAYFTRSVRAQGAVAATFQGGGAHGTCTTPVAGSYFLCVATDGIWISNNGAAYFQVVAPSGTAGVTSWNGLTGAVVYSPPAAPVSSVNGKTGAVVIAATTTLQ